MVTPELIHFIREQKAKGLVKNDISLLLSVAGWSSEDIKYGFELSSSDRGGDVPPKPVSNQKQTFLRSKKKAVVVTMSFVLVAVLFFLAGIIVMYLYYEVWDLMGGNLS